LPHTNEPAEVERGHRADHRARDERLVAVVVGRDAEHRTIGARDVLDATQAPLAGLDVLADRLVAVQLVVLRSACTRRR
jgi:hypothetical protein